MNPLWAPGLYINLNVQINFNTKKCIIVLENYEAYPIRGFPGGSEVKASAWNAGVPGLGRFPGEGNGNPLQYSCLENPMEGGAW